MFEVYLPGLPSTIIILAVIIFYVISLSLAQLIHKRLPSDKTVCQKNETYRPSVNIIVPAHNEAPVIEQTVEHLVQIDYPDYDILIMDDRSADSTGKIAQKLAEKYPGKVKAFSRPATSFPGKSAVLNDAMKMTDAEVICVFDADACVRPDFLANLVSYLSGEKTAAVQARKVLLNKNDGILTRFQHYEYSMDAHIQTGRDSLKGAVELRGNGQLTKRKALEEVGGWTVDTLTDDLDISTKLQLAGWDIRFCPDVSVYEEASDKWSAIFKQRKRWAEGSIRRYLDYTPEIFTSPVVSKRVALDLIMYFSEFILPVWLLSSLIIHLIAIFIFGSTPAVVENAIVLVLLALFFVGLLFISIYRFDHYNILKTLFWSLATSLFIIVLWTLVVITVVFKIIFTKREIKWYKTDRVAAGNSNL
jgi:1,2-diacylglycerol 3-beta-glucosyltransferase